MRFLAGGRALSAATHQPPLVKINIFRSRSLSPNPVASPRAVVADYQLAHGEIIARRMPPQPALQKRRGGALDVALDAVDRGPEIWGALALKPRHIT